MAKVKCACCGKQIDKKVAVAIPNGKRNKYYCSEHVGQKSPREKMYDAINDIFGYKVLNTILFKEFDEIGNVHTFEKVMFYIEENKDYLYDVVRRDFVSEYAKIRYFSAIFKNGLNDFVIKEPEVIIEKEVAVEIVETTNYKAKKQRRGMDDLLEGLLDD